MKLVAGDQEFTQKLTVLKDPHSGGNEADIAANTKMVTALRDAMNGIADTVAQAGSVRVQLATMRKEVGTEEVSKPVRDASEEMDGKLTAIEGHVLNFAITGRGQDDIRFAPMLADKLGYLAGEVGGSDFAPTTQQQQVFDELTRQELAFENDLDLFLSKDVVAFNNLLKERNASYIMVNPRKEKRALGAAK